MKKCFALVQQLRPHLLSSFSAQNRQRYRTVYNTIGKLLCFRDVKILSTVHTYMNFLWQNPHLDLQTDSLGQLLILSKSGYAHSTNRMVEITNYLSVKLVKTWASYKLPNSGKNEKNEFKIRFRTGLDSTLICHSLMVGVRERLLPHKGNFKTNKK